MEVHEGSRPSAVGQLYSISADGQVKKIQRDVPPNQDSVSFLSTYPGERLIVSLVEAIAKKTEDTPTFDSRRAFYLSISKRDGTVSRLIHLDLRFRPARVAILDSGRFVVLGIDTLNQKSVLGYLDSDGTYIRPIDLDSRPMEASPPLHEIYKETETHAGPGEMLMAAAEARNFVPYGEKILFVQSGSDLPVHVIGEGGKENAIKILLPKEFGLESILPAAPNQLWTVRVQRIASFAALQNNGIVSPEEELLEVDPLSGQARDILKVKGSSPGLITCAAAGRLISPRLVNPDKSTGDPGGWFCRCRADNNPGCVTVKTEITT